MSERTDDIVSIELTEAQQAQVKEVTGVDAGAIELGVTELEARISPITLE